MGVFATIVVGLVAGWLASLVMRTRTGLLIDMLLGVAGGFVGGWLTGLLLNQNMMSGINLTSILVAFVGAVVVIGIFRLFTRGRR